MDDDEDEDEEEEEDDDEDEMIQGYEDGIESRPRDGRKQ